MAIFKDSLTFSFCYILLRYLQVIIEALSFPVNDSWKKRVLTRDFSKFARLKRKLILQGKRLRRSQNDRAKKTHIFNENIGFASLY